MTTIPAKHAALFDAMNFSRFGPLAQIVIMDAFTKTGSYEPVGEGETNETLLRRVLAATPEVADEIEAHLSYVAALPVADLEEAFDKSGASRMFNPRAWHAATSEVVGKLAAI